jgi:hypothetical protein
MALLLMYLQSMESILDLVRFLNVHIQWLVTLDLNKTVHGKIMYKVPDRSTFYKFARRLGKEKMLEIFVHAVIQLINLGIIKGEKVSQHLSYRYRLQRLNIAAKDLRLVGNWSSSSQSRLFL